MTHELEVTAIEGVRCRLERYWRRDWENGRCVGLGSVLRRCFSGARHLKTCWLTAWRKGATPGGAGEWVAIEVNKINSAVM